MQDQLRTQAADKHFLLTIVHNNYRLPSGIDPYAFTLALLPNFASTDSELRDDISYMILARGIIDKQRLSKEQLQSLLEIVLDDQHLFYRIGSSGTDDIFIRSFSNLVIAALLFNDSHHPAFGAEIVHNVKEKLLQYATREKDWRGYVTGKGWAHALAHLSDALDECAQHPGITRADREEILRGISRLATLPVPFFNEEDVRLARIPYHIILGRQVSEEFIEGWLPTCAASRKSNVESWRRVTNSKNFLRSLYFLLYWDNASSVVIDQVADLLKKIEEIYLEEHDE